MPARALKFRTTRSSCPVFDVIVTLTRCRTREREADQEPAAALAPNGHGGRLDGEEPERVVEAEGALGGRAAPVGIHGSDRPAVAPFGLGGADPVRPGAAGERELVEAGLAAHPSRSSGRPRRPGEGRRDRRGLHDLVLEPLPLARAVAVRRERQLRRGRVHAVVHDEERLRDEPLAARVGRTAEELSAERHRRRAARVERGGRDDAEPCHRLRQLEVRHSRGVAGPASVDDEHHDPPVRALPDGRPRVATVEVVRAEILGGPEDRTSLADQLGTAAERLGHVAPLRPQHEPDGDRVRCDRLDGHPLGLRPSGDQHGAAGRDRRPTAPVLRDEADQVGVRRRGREGREHGLEHAVAGRGRRAVGRRVEGRPVRPRRPVDEVDRASRAGALPGAEHRDPVDAQVSGQCRPRASSASDAASCAGRRPGSARSRGCRRPR